MAEPKFPSLASPFPGPQDWIPDSNALDYSRLRISRVDCFAERHG